VYKTGLFVLGPKGLGREEFQSNGALELGVLSLVDDAHSALAEFRDNLVVGYGITDHALAPEQRPNGI
jgi:hypothetical protein